MELREWDFNKGNSGGFAEVEYPDEAVQRFVNWFRNTKAWREDTTLTYNHWLKFERDLTDCRNEAARGPAPVVPVETCNGETLAGKPCRITHGLVDGKCHIHRPYRPLATV